MESPVFLLSRPSAPFWQRMRAACGVLLVCGAMIAEARGCPFCYGSAQVTLRERIETFDVALIARWVGSDSGDADEGRPPCTTFAIVHTARGETFRAGDELQIDREHTGRPGELFLLSANRLEGTPQWDRVIPLTEPSHTYLSSAPGPQVPPTERLRYYVRFLEHPETLIANDAFQEFANAKYEDIAPLAGDLPRNKLRQWVFSPRTERVRIGVYGMLLGLCGAAADAIRMEAEITRPVPPGTIRIGIDGVMGGYLLLKGSAGLEVLDRVVIGNPAAPEGEVTAALMALRFVWQYGEGVVEKDRLRQSMRLALNRPERIALAVADLARWRDWTVVDRLIGIYDDEDLATRSEKEAIIRFLLVAARADRTGLSRGETAALDRAAETLEALRHRDPQLCERAERTLLR